MDDPFGNMREQMERERENFFKTVNPRDWPSDSSMRGGMFNRPRTSFGGFPSGSSVGAGLRSRDEEGHHSLPRSRREPQVDLSEGSEGSEQSSASSASQGDNDLSIPIRVVHEKPRPRYGQTQHSNTTELPAKAAAAAGTESPRLERAHSEPPGKFKQRLTLSNPSGYSTIPEYGESEQARPSPRSRPTNFSHSPIKTSASAPSVPGSSHNFAEPQPPPRRSPPRAAGMAGPGPGPGQAGNVRHIPIFVEGRPEPLQPARAQPGDLHKPSDYYPAGIQRVKSQEEPSSVLATNVEPTTPLGPPPGPIPMGYTAVHTEPTTPLGPPPGPIPMGYTPFDSLKPQPSVQGGEPTTPVGPPPGPIPMGYLPSQQPHLHQQTEELDVPVPPLRNRTPPQPEQTPVPGKQEPARKPSAEKSGPSDNSQRKVSESSENRKDPLVNVIPIKIEPSRPESPRPKQSSRAPSQDPPPPPPPPPPANPKIAKLDKIKDDVEGLMEKIGNFKGCKTDKEYLYLDEMLTRHLISLDGIDPEGELEIRQLRKESIKSVNRCLSLLDRKVSDVTGGAGDADDNNQVLSHLAEKSSEKSDNKTS